MSYLEHFHLRSEPFSNAPVSRFYFESDQHREALVRLMHVIERMKGLAVLVGEIGAGKTTLARRMLDLLPESEYEAALLVIVHSGVTPGWLLRRIANQLGVPQPAEEKLTLLAQLYQRLLQIYEQGRKAVVLIDEAQMLQTRELMEEFRGLLNLEVPERKLLSFVFFGLPEVEESLKLDPPLQQRVAMRIRLPTLSPPDTAAYVEFRLRQAGSGENPFNAEAIEAIHRVTHGTPRAINTVADNALLEAYLAGQARVDAGLIERVSENLGLFSGVRNGMATAAAQVQPGPFRPTFDLTEIDRYLEGLRKA
jgi:type II secretory pathway predicted ATPase ExeA